MPKLAPAFACHPDIRTANRAMRGCCLRFTVGNDAPALVAMSASNTPSFDCVFLVSHTGTARLIAHRLLCPPACRARAKKLY